MSTPDPSRLPPWPERARGLVLNILVLDGLSVLATALILRGGAAIPVNADPDWLKKAFLGTLFGCFVLARLVLRASTMRAREADPDARGRILVRSRVATALLGWLAMPLGLGYGLTLDPSPKGLAPFWVAAMLLGVTALPRASDLEEVDEPATETDA